MTRRNARTNPKCPFLRHSAAIFEQKRITPFFPSRFREEYFTSGLEDRPSCTLISMFKNAEKKPSSMLPFPLLCFQKPTTWDTCGFKKGLS